MGFGGQPRYSQDSIGEFQFISNRFDATMGRSAAVQVIAVTRSGTNRCPGRPRQLPTASSTPTPCAERVVPIDNQQLAFTLGGPIMRDKLHFFGTTSTSASRGRASGIRRTPPSRRAEGSETIKMGASGRLSTVTGDRVMGR